jgi:hypothetical protein
MLSKTLRLGPLVLIEMLACVVGVMLHMMFGKRCWSLALWECALSIYLVESLIAYHIIHKSKKHRREYLCKLAASPNSKLYPTLAWNQLILLTILAIFAVITVDDLIKLLRNDPIQ